MKQIGVSRPYFWISTILPALIFAGTAVYLALLWEQIPAEVPTHFGITGAADAWGGKRNLLTQVGGGAVLFVAFLVVSFFPKGWRLRGIGRSVDPAVALRAMGGLLADMRISIAVIFAFLTIWSAKCIPGPAWILTVVMFTSILVPLTRLLLRLYVLKR
jgi:uncharacterized membrane protein